MVHDADTAEKQMRISDRNRARLIEIKRLLMGVHNIEPSLNDAVGFVLDFYELTNGTRRQDKGH